VVRHVTDRLLSPRDVSELVPIGYHAILRAIKSGELRASELRGRYAIRPRDLEAWLEDNVVKSYARPSAGGGGDLGRLTGERGFRARAGATRRGRQ
jgi:excisionase family DNA binding protein